MFKKMVITLVVMIGSVTSYSMDNVQHIKDYYKNSEHSPSATAMRSETQRLYEQGRQGEAQWLAEQQLLWYKSLNHPFKTNKKKRQKI